MSGAGKLRDVKPEYTDYARHVCRGTDGEKPDGLFVVLDILDVLVNEDFFVEAVESPGNEEQTQHDEIKTEKSKEGAMKYQADDTAGGIGNAQAAAGALPNRSCSAGTVQVELGRHYNDWNGEEYLEVKHDGNLMG